MADNIYDVIWQSSVDMGDVISSIMELPTVLEINKC